MSGNLYIINKILLRRLLHKDFYVTLCYRVLDKAKRKLPFGLIFLRQEVSYVSLFKKQAKLFEEWSSDFMAKIELDPTIDIYFDDKHKMVYDVQDFMNAVKNLFIVQGISKTYLNETYISQGKVGVLKYMGSMMPYYKRFCA